MIWSLVILFGLSFCLCKDISRVTNSNFQPVTKQNKCVFLYVEKENCKDCLMFLHKFVTAAQTFQNHAGIFFGRVFDETLIQLFEVDSFPELVYYEFGSAVPKRYRGDITADSIINIVTETKCGDFSSLKRHHALEISKSNFRELLFNTDQYRLVMLHEEDDLDDIKAFDDLAETYDNEKEFVIARIDVDKNKSLRREFALDTYPCFYWYEKGIDVKRKRYGGDMNLKQMIRFINKATGFQREAGGKLGLRAGLIKPLDELLKTTIKDIYELKNLDYVITQMKNVAANVEDNDKIYADYYIECLEEIKEDNTIDSLTEQRNRLFRMMDDAGPLTQDDIRRKINIVNKYIDMIGYHLIGDFPKDFDEFTDRSTPVVDDIHFHEEL